MAYSHIKIIGLSEEIDTEGKPRIRLQFEDYKPRSGTINLKNATAQHLNQLKSLIGGTAMVGIKEGMFNGALYYSFLPAEEIVPIHQPEKIPVSKVVEVDHAKEQPKPEGSKLAFR